MRIRFILALVFSTSVAMAQIKPTFFQYGPKIGAQLATVQIIDSPIEASFNNNVKLVFFIPLHSIFVTPLFSFMLFKIAG